MVEEIIGRICIPRRILGRQKVAQVDGSDDSPANEKDRANVNQDAVDTILNSRKPCFAGVSDVGRGPSKANAAHGEFELESPRSTIEECCWPTNLCHGRLIHWYRVWAGDGIA